jgi:hypothetical protein
MGKVIISYPFLYYSFYRYYLTKWEFSSDWPQGWAVVALSMLIALSVAVVELSLAKFGVRSFSYMPSLPWVFEEIQSAWAFILAMIINFYFFFAGNRWSKYINCYDSLPEQTKIRSHWASVIVIATILAIFFIRILTFEHFDY